MYTIVSDYIQLFQDKNLACKVNIGNIHTLQVAAYIHIDT